MLINEEVLRKFLKSQESRNGHLNLTSETFIYQGFDIYHFFLNL